MDKRLGTVLLLTCGLAAAACGGSDSSGAGAEPARKVVRAMAYVDPKSGSELTGTAVFVNETTQVSMQLDVENAPPGEHAVHIHEFGDCSADDASSAGGHWNPTGEAHGKWDHGPHHLGDIGNITVGADGKGSLTFSATTWSLGTGEPNDILGKSLVIHAKPDDFTSQPSGAAGPRIGCGVIE